MNTEIAIGSDYSVFDHLLEGCRVIGHDWRYIYMNDAAARHARTTKEAFLGRKYTDLFPDTDTPISRLLKDCMVRRHAHHVENKHVFSDGSTGWFEIRMQPVPDGIFILTLDITERKLAELKVRENEARLSSIFLNSPLGIVMTRMQDGKIIDVNEAFAKLHGYSRDEIVGKSSVEMNMWEMPFEREYMLERLNKEKTITGMEIKSRKKNGEIFDLRISVELLEQNGELYTIGIGQDITEERKAGKTIKAIEEQFANAFHTSPIPQNITVTDTGEIVAVNHAFCTLFGFQPEELLGFTTVKLNMWENSYDRDKALSQMQSQGYLRMLETNIRVRSGEIRTVLVSFEKITWKNKPCIISSLMDITDRKQTENALRESETKFRKIYEEGPFGMVIVDKKFMFVSANATFCRLIGYTEEELQHLSFKDITHPDDQATDLQEVPKLIKGEIPVYKTEKRYIRKDSQVIWVAITVTANYSVTGQFNYNVAIVEDITARKHSEQAIRLSEEKFSKAFMSSVSALIVTRFDDGTFIDMNDEYCRIVGYSREELLGKRTTDLNIFIQVEDRQMILQKLTTDGVIRDLEMKIRNRAGEIRDIMASQQVIDYKNEKTIITSMYDVTERKRNEMLIKEKTEEIEAQNEEYLQINEELYQTNEELHEAKDRIERSEEKFRKAFFTNPDAVTITRLKDGMYTQINHGFIKLLEHHEDETVGKTSIELKIWHDASQRKQFVDLLITNGIVENFEARFNTKSGRIFDGLVSSVVITLEGDLHILSITKDISYRKKFENELILAKELAEQSEKDFRLLAESMPQIVWVTRADGGNIYFNQPWVDYTGLSLEESYGHGWNAPFHPDDKQRAWEAWRNAVKNDTSYSLECQLRRNDGVYRWWLIRGVPIKDEHGTIIKWFGTCTDIHEIKQTEKDLFEAKEKAEKSDRLKTAFLQNMSHEIRTPMNAIMGFSDLLVQNYNDKPKLEKFANVIKQRSNDLLDIINEVLDVAKIESGHLPVNIEECRLALLFNDIATFFSEVQKKQNKQHITFTTHVPIGANIIIRTDKVKLKQILINLIGNAFKFTDKGKIDVGCRFNNEQKLLFYVSDTGIGIPQDKQDFIFERFAQLEATPNHLYGGTGLGLSIVKGLIDLLGGKVWLESEVSKGSTFYFSIPYEMVSTPVEYLAQNKEEKYNFTNKTVLIVEDDQYNADLIAELMDQTGIKAINAYTGNEAIELAKSEKLDIVLMDIRLPDMDGYRATQVIRKLKPELTIIAQTAYAALEDKEKAIQAGCNDYISKPIKKELLLPMMEKHLYR